MNNPNLLEISDFIVDFDFKTLQRKPVEKAKVVDRFRSAGDSVGADIVNRMPAHDGILDPGFVDQLLVRVHCEMQRLSEEFQHGQRTFEVLLPLVNTLKKRGVPGPFRIVDVGCGTGYVVRWLAAWAQFDFPVQLIGVDFNSALISEAKRLASLENLNCQFDVANAFALSNPGTVFISTGFIHHFRGDALIDFFKQHDQPPTQAFAHFDFQPNIFARPGAWLFHFIRMREPLSRHDGVISARRAHPASTLLQAARQTSFASGIYSAKVGRLPIPRVFHTLLGLRREFVGDFRNSLGSRASRLETME